MKKHKLLIEIAAFFLVLTAGCSVFYEAVRQKDMTNGGGLEAFKMQEAVVDVEVFGASHAGCTVNNAILWRDYGISSQTLWSGSQAVDGTFLFMQEAFKKQKPKVALVETLDFVGYIDDERSVYVSGLATSYSADYIKYILDMSRDFGYSRQYTEELLFRMPVVHSRYKEWTKEDFVREHAYNMGYQGSDMCTPDTLPGETDRREDVPPLLMHYIEKIIDLCEENDVELVFFRAPYILNEDDPELARQNSLGDYLAERGIPFLDYYTNYEICDIDFLTDLREGNHLNDLGAAKVTNVLASYLKENYDIPDRRGEAGYEDWDLHARYIDSRQLGYKLKRCWDLDEYLKILEEYNKELVFIVTFGGNYKAVENYAQFPEFSRLGLSEDDYSRPGVVVIKNGEVIWKSYENENENYYTELNGAIDLNIYRLPGQEDYLIRLDENDYSKSINGFGITVYDEASIYLLDDVTVDVYEGLSLNRKNTEYGD